MRQPRTLTMLSCAMMVLAALLADAVDASAQSTNPVKLVKGTITDSKTGRPIDGGRVNVYAGSATETTTSSKINPRTGAFQVIIGPSTQYRFEVVSPRYYTGVFNFRSPDGNNYQESVQDFKVEPIPIGTVLFNGRLFEPGSAKLLAQSNLQNVADLMNKQVGMMVGITLIADMPPAAAAKKPAPAKKPKKGAAPVVETTPQPPAGDPVKALLEERTAALRGYFKAQGISTARLQWDPRPTPVTVGKGKTMDNVTIKISGVQTDDE